MSSTGHFKTVVGNPIVIPPTRTVANVLGGFSLKGSVVNKEVHLGNTVHTSSSQETSALRRDSLLLVTVVGVSLMVVHWLDPADARVLPELSDLELDSGISGRDNLNSPIWKRTSSFITSLGDSTGGSSNTLLSEIRGQGSDGRIRRRIGGVGSSTHRVITGTFSWGTNSPDTLLSFSVSRASSGGESGEKFSSTGKVHVGAAGRSTLSDSTIVLREDSIVGRISSCASAAGATVLDKEMSKTSWFNELTVLPGALAFDLGSLTPESDFVGWAERTITSLSSVTSMTDGASSLLTPTRGGVDIDTDVPHALVTTVGVVSRRGFLNAEAQTSFLSTAVVNWSC